VHRGCDQDHRVRPRATLARRPTIAGALANAEPVGVVAGAEAAEDEPEPELELAGDVVLPVVEVPFVLVMFVGMVMPS